MIENQEVFKAYWSGSHTEHQSTSTPRFFKARKVPYALKGTVDEELFRSQIAGIISPVQYSNWATPIVPVVKSNGAVGICGDYKRSVNPVLEVDRYLLLDIEPIGKTGWRSGIFKVGLAPSI